MEYQVIYAVPWVVIASLIVYFIWVNVFAQLPLPRPLPPAHFEIVIGLLAEHFRLTGTGPENNKSKNNGYHG